MLESQAPDTWKEPRLKSANRQLRQWTKKIRQPGGTRIVGHDNTDNEDEYNLSVGPLQQFMGNIAKIQKGIKRKAVSNIPQTPVTPAIKQSAVTHASGKKPKYSFKTGSKGKRLLPKTSQKTPLSAKGWETGSAWTCSQSYKTSPKSKGRASASLVFATAYGTEPWDTPAKQAASATKRITRGHRKQHWTSLYKAAVQGAKKGVLKKTRNHRWLETVWNVYQKETRWPRLVNGNVQDHVEGDSEGENLIFKENRHGVSYSWGL